MKIALVGYGKMGHAIEKIALARGHKITATIDLDNNHLICLLTPQNTDVIIEFSHPESAVGIHEQLIPLGIPLVVGTTGWYSEMEKTKQLATQHGTSFIYSSNFSLGVNVLFKINQILARLMNLYPQYDVFIEERHHSRKADAPSGTGFKLAEAILKAVDRKTKIVMTDELRDRPPHAHELGIASIRAGNICGRHVVGYTSEVDTLTICHEAHNREGFALGAVIAAEWIIAHKGFYEFSDIFEL